MIYADTSFLCSLYFRDSLSQKALVAYQQHRPIFAFTSWQRFELRNTIRLACVRNGGKLSPGNAFKAVQQDLDRAILRHLDADWMEILRKAESLSDKFTMKLQCKGADVIHVASAMELAARYSIEAFWTFDDAQRELAHACGAFAEVW
jgi:predicted nucleic acid-binding protein